MKIFLVGVGCVGKSSIGNALAKLFGFRFFDFDDEVETYFNSTIERIRNRFIGDYSYRVELSVVLKKIIAENPDNYVVALPPSGIRDCFYKILKKVDSALIIEIQDYPENILERIEFFDIDSKKIKKKLNEMQLKQYLKEIKKDITYFKRFYLRAGLHFHLNGRGIAESAKALKQRF